MDKEIEKENMFEAAIFDQKIKIEDMIYEINEKQVMSDSEISRAK